MPYRGRIEYGASGQTEVEIDDLDAADWVGQPVGVFLIGANRPEVWFVGVVLMDGPRAGEFATADLIVRRDPSQGEPSVKFAGRSAFAPHWELIDLDASRRSDALAERVPSPPPVIDDYADREPGLAILILERPRRPRDELRDPSGRLTDELRADTVRLALDDQGRRVYVAEGARDDSIFLIYQGTSGGGACGTFRSNLAKYGVVHMTNRSSAGDDVIVGVVPDDVIGVHLDDRPAVMGENVFIADRGSTGRTLRFTTRTGHRQVPIGRPDEGGAESG